MLDERAVGLEPDDAPVVHRHDEHPAVGQPADAGRPPLDDADLLDLPVEIDRQDLLRPHVGEDQAPVMPPGSLGEPEPLGQQRSLHARIIAQARRPRRGQVCVGASSIARYPEHMIRSQLMRVSSTPK